MVRRFFGARTLPPGSIAARYRTHKTVKPAVRPQNTAKPALKNGERLVLQVCDQHQARRVRDREWQLRSRNDRLRCDAAGPENGNLVSLDRHRIAIIGLPDVT